MIILFTDIMKKLEELKSTSSFKKKVLISWKAHVYPIIKVNSERAVRRNPSLAGARHVHQNSKGEWIIGAMQNLVFT